ncbi:Probable conserved lipoprotein LppF [Mycobacteroides abscessus]|uniref:phosphoserine phosphatase n=3 Tax=Mycobacteroides abscessus TaxID=36809 RepID=A0A829HRH6_9MYCO|nr:HAD family hydrolase [Mycobacteroides abscessus]ESV56622.1 haloacid dehalogenase-like hydrolase family protein [Mycobacteroides abscessus MAB_082312_2258]ESV65021.1 haloacid dehalogenase-like hydrolase family protein [Mycobacteroides abscessus MAB_091912_2446]AIC71485.1 hypothetical protein MYCMA_05440 [Mycobacteroides abscessus subsp. massiliense str. GO 06]AMU27521.1 hypothetical protein A3N96_20680 [Mycobacteroides abscessus]AMU37201.1 hypothetical protein A3N98_19875 [Mycobacteroides ab
MRATGWLVIVLSLVLAPVARNTGLPAAQAAPGCRQLDSALPWYGDVRQRLQAAIDANSTCTGTWKRSTKAVALFDWDNTEVKNDIADATLAWMLRHDKVLQPTDWHATSRHITEAAAAALRTACGTDTPAGRPLLTSANAACADEILAVREGKTHDGQEAFTGYNQRWSNGAYVWTVALTSGYTAGEVAGFAQAAKRENLAAPVGATQTIGSTTVPGYVRVYPQIKDLIATLQAHGVSTWVISASSEVIAKVWSPEIGIPTTQVIGVRSVYDASGRQTPHVQGCGGQPDGADTVITYVDGKRCWANQVVFGVQGPAAFEPYDVNKRQILAAGDSTTDVTFVDDATAAHLVINRNKTELMCRAYDNADGKWLITPMFIDPDPQRTDPYPCATDGRTNPDGSTGPLLRSDGSVVPDQKDTVFSTGM